MEVMEKIIILLQMNPKLSISAQIDLNRMYLQLGIIN